MSSLEKITSEKIPEQLNIAKVATTTRQMWQDTTEQITNALPNKKEVSPNQNNIANTILEKLPLAREVKIVLATLALLNASPAFGNDIQTFINNIGASPDQLTNTSSTPEEPTPAIFKILTENPSGKFPLKVSPELISNALRNIKTKPINNQSNNIPGVTHESSGNVTPIQSTPNKPSIGSIEVN